jgi:hypothetical protein
VIPDPSINDQHATTTMDPAEYCREIETYLCRKNEGHLIRIVGPAFEQVTGWAAQGVPLPVAFRGIDLYCERYYAKGPRRRPVRIEFCEADILELFDDWRRAVGVPRLDDAAGADGPATRDSLPAHIERAMARLTALRAGRTSEMFDRRLDDVVRELDRARATAKHARGDARAALLDRLTAMDHELLQAARTELDPSRTTALEAAARAEIAPFAARMADEARAHAVAAAFDRLLRDALGLPVLAMK